MRRACPDGSGVPWLQGARVAEVRDIGCAIFMCCNQMPPSFVQSLKQRSSKIASKLKFKEMKIMTIKSLVASAVFAVAAVSTSFAVDLGKLSVLTPNSRVWDPYFEGHVCENATYEIFNTDGTRVGRAWHRKGVKLPAGDYMIRLTDQPQSEVTVNVQAGETTLVDLAK